MFNKMFFTPLTYLNSELNDVGYGYVMYIKLHFIKVNLQYFVTEMRRTD